MQRHPDRTPETKTVAETEPVTAPERPKLQISATTITAGAVASVSAALLGSTLGVAGTVAGAAIGAVVSSLASALYQHSVAAARFRMQNLRAVSDGHAWLPVRRESGLHPAQPGSSWNDGAALDSETTQEIPMVALLDAVVDGAAETGAVAGLDAAPAAKVQPPKPRAPRNPRRPQRPGGWLDNWRGVLAGSLGAAFAFALALVIVTGIESAKGAPLSGGPAGGLSVLGGGSYQKVGSGSTPDTLPDTVTVQSPAPETPEPVAPSKQTTTETVISTHTQTETATETETEPATGTSESTVPVPPGSGESQPTTAPSTPPVTTAPPAQTTPPAQPSPDASPAPSGGTGAAGSEFAPSKRLR